MSPTGTVTPPYPRHFPPAISAGMRSEAFIRRCSSRCCRRAGRPAVFLLRCGHPISRGIGRAACDVVANPSHQSFRCRAIARVRCGRQNRAVRFYSVSRFRARIGSGSSVQNASMPEADRQSFLQVFTRLCPQRPTLARLVGRIGATGRICARRMRFGDLFLFLRIERHEKTHP